MIKFNQFIFKVLGLICLLILLLLFWSSGACSNENWHKRNSADGVITEKFIDKENHNAYTLRIDSKSVYRIMAFEGEFGGLERIYDSIMVGDRLIKEKGTLDLVIIRGDQRMVFTHDTGCDENWWKFWEKLKF